MFYLIFIPLTTRGDVQKRQTVRNGKVRLHYLVNYLHAHTIYLSRRISGDRNVKLLPQFRRLRSVTLGRTVTLIRSRPIPLLVSMRNTRVPITRVTTNVRLLPVLRQARIGTNNVGPVTRFFRLHRRPIQRARIQKQINGVDIRHLAVDINRGNNVVNAFNTALSLGQIRSYDRRLQSVLGRARVLKVRGVHTILLLVSKRVLAQTNLLRRIMLPTTKLNAIAAINISPRRVVQRGTPATGTRARNAIGGNLGFRLQEHVIPSRLSLIR